MVRNLGEHHASALLLHRAKATVGSYCMVAFQTPLAELKDEPAPVEAHDQVPDAVAGADGLGSKVPPNRQVTFEPPMPAGWKLATPLSEVSEPVPAPGTVTVILLP